VNAQMGGENRQDGALLTAALSRWLTPCAC